MRAAVLTRSGVFLVAVAFSGSLSAQAMAENNKHAIDIPSGELSRALDILSKQSGSDVVYRPEQVRGLQTVGITGDLSTEAAAAQLIRGTKLTVSVDVSGAVLIATPLVDAHNSAVPRQSTDADVKEGKGGSSNGFRLAQADTGLPSPAAPLGNGVPRVEEIVVTAQKREERLQDVPVPMTAVNAQSLIAANQVRLQDWYASVPGLNVTPSNQSAQFITIRGLNTGGFQNPLVAIDIDDVPFGSSTELGGGYAVPDFDPSDLQRVEVLRGPQGTLYGANSMGGLIKFVTVDPSTDRFSGRVEAGTSNVSNGAQWGYTFRASANVPLTDTLAVRASAFTRQDPGYIDNPVSGIDGVNEAHYSGGRIASLWSPSDRISLKVSALYQVASSDGGQFAYVQPGLRDLQVNDIPGLDGYRRSLQNYNATLRAKLGEGELTSITGYNVNAFKDSEDISYAFPDLGGPNTGLAILSNNRTNKLSQEVRYATPLGRRLDLLVGVFYTHEKSVIQQSIPILTDSGALVSDLAGAGGLYPTFYSEYAGFTDLTVHVTERIDIQFGGREGHINQAQGPDVADTVPPTPSDKFHADSNAFTYLVTPQVKLTDAAMLYARFASGYRPGGINVLPLPGQLGYNAALPRSYDPDKTTNYEVGFKGDFLEHVLSVDSSLYYIRWQDIQLSELSANNGYITNGSRAKSQGIELAIDVHPSDGLAVSMWGSWNDAKLTQALPPSSSVPGADGQQLPYSSKFSGHVAVTDDFPLSGALSGFAAAEINYVGARPDKFSAAPVVIQPGYAQTNLRVGTKYDSWEIRLFANNVTDRRGVVGKDLNPASFYYIQPRTVGLAVSKTF